MTPSTCWWSSGSCFRRPDSLANSSARVWADDQIACDRVLALVQFDAASLSLVERMLSEGRLPALAALLQRGRWQPLEVGHDLFEAGTYPVLYSGQDLGEHGLYPYPFVWSAAEQRLRYMDVFPTPQTVCERLAEAGRPSLVIDPYQLWAPSETPGGQPERLAVSAQDHPRLVAPPERVPETARSIGRPPLVNDVVGPRSAPGLLKMYRDLLAGPGRAAGAVVELMARESFDLVWVTFIAAHQAGHQLWDLPRSATATTPRLFDARWRPLCPMSTKRSTRRSARSCNSLPPMPT